MRIAVPMKIEFISRGSRLCESLTGDLRFRCRVHLCSRCINAVEGGEHVDFPE